MINLTKKEVVERFCLLSTNLQDKIGTGCHVHATDCFCDDNSGDDSSYRFDEEVLVFIEEAVEEKLGRIGE